MARPVLDSIDSGLQAWDAACQSNFEALTQAPIPLPVHAGSPGDESDLEAAYPAAQYDRCCIVVTHSVHGVCLALSDGAAWRFLVPV